MKLGLRSDFSDYYDHHLGAATLTPDAFVWRRMSHTRVPRRLDFLHMEEAGLMTPAHGLAGVFASLRYGSRPDLVVAYEDETAHRGEGKRRCDPADVAPDVYVSVYHNDYEGRAVSYRCVLVGRDRAFWLRYESEDSWRSNVGEVKITSVSSHDSEALAALRRLQVMRCTPLVAVDFVESGAHVRPLAIDLNTAPGLRGSPLEGVLSPSDVADALRERWPEVNLP